MMDVTAMEVDKKLNVSVEDSSHVIDTEILDEFVVIKPEEIVETSSNSDTSKTNNSLVEKVDINSKNNDKNTDDKSEDNGECLPKELSKNSVEEKADTSSIDEKKSEENKNIKVDTNNETVTKNISVNKIPEIKISPPDAAAATAASVEETNLNSSTKERIKIALSLNDSQDSVDSSSVIEETIVIATLDNSDSADEEIIEQSCESIEYNLVDYSDIVSDTEEKLINNESKNQSVVLEIHSESLKARITDSPKEVSKKITKNDVEKSENGNLIALKSPKKEEKVDKKLTSSPEDKQRSLIEDIFDDWTDETVEEEPPKSHDDVEHQLKSLLDDGKQKDEDETAAVKKNIQSSSKIIVKNEEKKKEIPPLKTPVLNKSKQIVDKKSVNTPAAVTIVKDKLSSIKKDDSPVVKKHRDEKPLAALPALIPLENTDKKLKNDGDKMKKDNDDNTDLLAILEGDVDPGWSNLQPPTLTIDDNEAKKMSSPEQLISQKLEKLTERDIALKQLIQLPKSPAKISTTSPSTPKRRLFSKKLIETCQSPKSESDSKDSPAKVATKSDQESDDKEFNELFEIKTEETRSGRKRKPTEKAREHEISAKRQKLIKTKSSLPKKVVSKKNEDSNLNENSSSSMDIHDNDSSSANDQKSEVEENDTADEKPATPVKKQKEESPLKGAGGVTKKIVAKKATKPSPAAALKKPGKKITGKLQKKSSGQSSSSSSSMPAPTETKPKKKNINEIDRLLQDEGVVNLLYDVEQPRTRRLIPVTKSQVKVMDMHKVQRELKIRTKLVRNAVLRLRTSSTSPTKVSPRAKRCVSINYDQENQQQQQQQQESTPEKSSTDKKGEQMKSPRSPTEFIFPAKIRNAADASVIVRRHSSSSFSSTSGSPRVSFDGPRRDLFTHDNNHEDNQASIRANKRRISQDNKKKIADAKKAKKQQQIMSLQVKKIDSKKTRGSTSQLDDTSDDNASGKTTNSTKSNGSVGKNNKSSKKNQKSKVKIVKEEEEEEEENDEDEDDNIDENDEENEDDKMKNEIKEELKVCLTDAVAENSPNRGKNNTNRKSKQRNSSTGDDKKVRLTFDKLQFSNKEINVQKHGYLVQLIMTPSVNSKIRNGITLKMMEEFKDILSILKKDDDCRVVLLTSTGSSFCEGLELSTLLHDNKDVRRTHAQQLAKGVKDFIKSLATFNKPIVAGVQGGSTVGLGVTMLPLFDLVIASDKASFSTPYGKLGQIAEGAAIFTLSHLLGSAVTNELLLGGRTLTANEALRAGLVTRVLWPDRFHVELLPSLRAMSEQSSQSMEATKALLRHSFRTKLDAALESECYLLIQHWCSTECQDAIRAYLDKKE